MLDTYTYIAHNLYACYIHMTNIQTTNPLPHTMVKLGVGLTAIIAVRVA